MKNKLLILLSAFFKSTSGINKLKYSHDRKVKAAVKGSIVGLSILYICLLGLCGAMAIGYGAVGLGPAIPALMVIVVSLLSFVFTILKASSFMFGFKEYDMIMSMPLSSKTIVSAKFLFMYIKSLPWIMCVSVAMLVGYGVFVKPPVYVYFLWIILSAVIPIAPSVLASALSSLVTGIGAASKHKKLVQTILSFAVIILAFASRFIIEALFKDNQAEVIFTNLSQITDKASSIYLPGKWFANAVSGFDILSIVLILGVSFVLYEIFFLLVSKFYRRINSRLKTSRTGKKFKMQALKTKSVVSSVAFKEFKRFTGSPLYITNMGFGEIAILAISVLMLILTPEKILGVFVHDETVSINLAILRPAIPIFVYFCVGMMSTTVCSPSLEGKNYWIVQSMPIRKLDLYNGKMLFNLYLTVPFTVVSTIFLCISFKAGVIDTVIYCLCGVMFCAFSTCWGMVCGLKFLKLDWENEVEVIKGGKASLVYMLPNMLITMILMVAVVLLGFFVNPTLVNIILALIAMLLAFISYMSVRRKALKGEKR